MLVNMDSINKRILFELSKDSRISYTQLAKKARIKQETARYRVNRLIENKIIKFTPTVINSSLLGRSHYQYFIKLRNVNEKTKQTIIDFLKNNLKVSWCAKTEGNYDVTFILQTRNQLEFQKAIDEFNDKFRNNIMRKTISVNLMAEFFPRYYLVNEQIPNNNEQIISVDKLKTIDETDIKILKLLAINSRLSSVEIGEKIGVSHDTVIQRIKQLKKENLITGHMLLIDNEKINQYQYKIMLYLDNISKEKVQSLFELVKKNNRLIAIVKVAGEWDYEIDLEVENVDQLNEFTMEITNKFSDIIRDYEILRIKEMQKFNFFL